MKSYVFGALLSFGILATPVFTQAAGLTTAQSTSLIAVVQSSPGTPASAFVNLITAFSNITINQATSLIAVVQSAPAAPTSAFVDLLVSFTADISATPTTNQAVTQQPSQSTTVSQTPTVTVIYPNGGEVLDNSETKGPIATIKWTSVNLGSLPIDIYLTDSNGIIVKTIASNLQNTGSYYWYPDPTIPNASYKINVSSHDKGPTAGDDSNNYFNIVNSSFGTSSNNPSISVTNPAGGNGYQAGVPGLIVVWSESGFTPKSMQIMLNGTVNGFASIILANLGASTQSSFSGTVPNVPSGNYTISVCDNDTPSPMASFKPLCGNSAQFSITGE